MNRCPALILLIASTLAPALSAAAEGSGAAGWVDVTAPIDPATTPIYPGDAPIKLDFLQHLDKGGKLTLSAFAFGAHTGTHVDAPMHFIKGGDSLDKLSLDRFMGPVR